MFIFIQDCCANRPSYGSVVQLTSKYSGRSKNASSAGAEGSSRSQFSEAATR